jgi:hypothetical protein
MDITKGGWDLGRWKRWSTYCVVMLYLSGLMLGACLTAAILTIAQSDPSTLSILGLGGASLAFALNSIAFYIPVRLFLRQVPTSTQTQR